jgi:hypothetical protein
MPLKVAGYSCLAAALEKLQTYSNLSFGVLLRYCEAVANNQKSTLCVRVIVLDVVQ